LAFTRQYFAKDFGRALNLKGLKTWLLDYNISFDWMSRLQDGA